MAKKYILPALFLILAVLAFKHAPGIGFQLGLAKTDTGQTLLHGISENIAPFEMPLVPLASGLLQNQVPRQWQPYFLTAAFVLCLLCFSSLSSFLQNPLQGFFSFALLTVFWVSGFQGLTSLDLEQLLYSGALAASAACLAAAYRSGSALWWGLAGAALGLSLLIRSAMFLLPVLLAAGGLIPLLRRLPSPRPRHYLVLFAVPLLVAAGWFYMNKAVFSRGVFLESKRAHCNMITGALGVVATIEGDFYKLAGITPEDNVMAWAAREAARHPLRYAGSVLRRLQLVLSEHPLLLLAALAGFWLFRRDKGFMALGALELYFLLVHCSMSVQERYFVPFWALLVPAAVAPLGLAAERLGFTYGAKKSGPLHALPFLPLAAFSLFTLALVLVYPARVERRPFGMETIGALAQKAPSSPWLQGRLGRIHLKEGRPAEAADTFQRAYDLSLDSSYMRDRALALMSGGRYGELLPVIAGYDLGYEGLLIRMFYELKTGKYKDAALSYELARGRQLTDECFLRRITNPYEAGVYSRLLEVDTVLKDIRLNNLLNMLSLQEALDLADRFPKIGLDASDILFRSAMELQHLGKYDKAAKIIGRLLAARPGDPEYLNAGGVLDCFLGDFRAGAGKFKRAVEGDPEYIPAYINLGSAYLREGKRAEAAAAYKAASRRCRAGSRLCANIPKL